MSIEQTLVCDTCSRVLNAAPTAAIARSQAREQIGYRRIAGRDLCADCVAELPKIMGRRRPTPRVMGREHRT